MQLQLTWISANATGSYRARMARQMLQSEASRESLCTPTSAERRRNPGPGSSLGPRFNHSEGHSTVKLTPPPFQKHSQHKF